MLTLNQKSGTTWLYKRLQEVNGFNLFPIKELHYFDRSDKYLSHSILNQTKGYSRFFNPQWLRVVTKDITESLKQGSFTDIRWKLNYYLSNYNDEWYCSLSKNREGISGDLTPAYAMLDKVAIQNIQSILPKVKIIFLLRNPVDRAWSHFKFSKRYDSFTKVDHQEAIRFFNSPQQEMRSDYIKTIKSYQSVFPPQQILIGFFDAIKDQPLNLLTKIIQFLGDEPVDINNQCKLQERNNLSPSIKIPTALNVFLQEKYSTPIAIMAKEFGGYCTVWKNNNKSSSLPSPVFLPNQIVTFEK